MTFKESVMFKLRMLCAVTSTLLAIGAGTIHASGHARTLVLTMTNDPQGNQLKVYDADSRALLQTLSTHGKGGAGGMMGGGMMGGDVGKGMCPMMGGGGMQGSSGMMGGMGPMSMMGGATTKVDVKKVDKGVTITMTSPDPATAARLQKMAEAMRLMHEATAQ